MWPALDSTGHRVPRTKPTCLLHTRRPHRQRPFALVLHLHQHQSNHNLHLQYLAKNQATQCCQSLITPRSDHPPVLEPHMVPNMLHPKLSYRLEIMCGKVGIILLSIYFWHAIVLLHSLAFVIFNTINFLAILSMHVCSMA
jgi:hypothetical protein